MQTTDCTKFQEDLKAYADGELTLAKRLQVGAHLERCAACREEVTQMEQIARDVRSLENISEVALSPELRAKVLARVNEVRPLISPSIPFWKRNPFLVIGSVGATLAAATVLILMYRPAEQTAMSEFAKASQPASTDAMPSASAGAAAPSTPPMVAMEKQEGAAREADKMSEERVAVADAPTIASTEARAQSDTVPSKVQPNPARQVARTNSDKEQSLTFSAYASPAPVAKKASRALPGDSKGGVSGSMGASRAGLVTQNAPAARARFAGAKDAKNDVEGERKYAEPAKNVAAEMSALAPPAPAPPAAVVTAPAPVRRAATTVASRAAAADTNEEIRLVIEVEDIKAAEKEIERLTKEVGGSVTQDAPSEEVERKPLTARVPVKDVDSFRKSVSQLGKQLPADTDTAKAKAVTGGFGGGGAAKPAAENKTIRVILVRKPSP